MSWLNRETKKGICSQCKKERSVTRYYFVFLGVKIGWGEYCFDCIGISDCDEKNGE